MRTDDFDYNLPEELIARLLPSRATPAAFWWWIARAPRQERR